MTNYEIMFIVNPNQEESSIKALVKDLEKVLTDNKAVIKDSKELGQKELAYEIKKHKSGYYFVYQIEANKEAVKEFDRIALINENVIRHLVINLDKE